MIDKQDLYVAAGIVAAVVAVAVVAYIVTKPRPTFVSFTRDSEGRVIEIIEKPMG